MATKLQIVRRELLEMRADVLHVEVPPLPTNFINDCLHSSTFDSASFSSSSALMPALVMEMGFMNDDIYIYK